MTKELIPLTKSQKEVMHEFYGISPTKVLLKKRKGMKFGKLLSNMVNLILNMVVHEPTIKKPTNPDQRSTTPRI